MRLCVNEQYEDVLTSLNACERVCQDLEQENKDYRKNRNV